MSMFAESNNFIPILMMAGDIILVFIFLYLFKKVKTFNNSLWFLSSAFLVILNIVVIASLKTMFL